MQAEFGPLLDKALAAGPWGLLTLYLLYKDAYKPWRNGKSNSRASAANGQALAFNPKDFASEKDVADLATSFREFRREAGDHNTDLSQRLLRLEIRTDGLERDNRDDRRE